MNGFLQLNFVINMGVVDIYSTQKKRLMIPLLMETNIKMRLTMWMVL